MTRPVSYLQTDPRWKDLPYAVKGERATIGGSGCGPTSMAMVLATWVDPSVTPRTECAWALAHGYKARGQGTYYSYFVPAAARYGLTCTRLNGSSLYGSAASPVHQTARHAVEAGDLVIACMGPGAWTRSGHFVLVWGFDGDSILINDPASTKDSRTRGDWSLFRQQVKYYWAIRRPKGKEEKDMTDQEVRAIVANLTDAEALALVEKALRAIAAQPEPDWSVREGVWRKAVQMGVVDGKGPERPLKRDEAVAMLGRLGLI